MSTLRIDDQTTVTNTSARTLNVSIVSGQGVNVVSVSEPQINVITVTGPQGEPGTRGPAGTGNSAAAGVSSLNGLTGVMSLIASGQNFSVGTSGSSIYVGANYYDYLLQSSIEMGSAGLVEGGRITVASPPNQFNIEAGIGYVNDNSGIPGSFKRVVWNAAFNQLPVSNSQNYVAIDGNGALSISAVPHDEGDYIILGHLYLNPDINVITVVWNVPIWVGNFPGRVNDFVADCLGTLIASGFGVTAQDANGRALNVQGGELFVQLSSFSYGPQTGFLKIYGTSNLGIIIDANEPNLVSTSQWNDVSKPAGSALINMTPSYWKKDLVLLGTEGGVFFAYGQSEYPDQDSAKQAPIPYANVFLADNNAFLYTIVSQAGDISVTNSLYDVRPILSRAFGTQIENAAGLIISYNQLIDKPTHNQLPGLQGGTGGQYYHLTSGQYTGTLCLSNRLTVQNYLAFTGASGAALNIGTGGALGALAYLNSVSMTGAGGVTQINGLSGNLSVSGAQGISVMASGQVLYVSGQDWALNSSLTQTGVQLMARDVSVSGALDTKIVDTGNSAITHANGIGVSLSGALTATGLAIGLVSGALALNLTNTGVTLINRDISISGGLEVRITATGTSVINHANSIGFTLSGNLISTGVQLVSSIATSGQQAWTAANTNAIVLSGNMTQTGIQLAARDAALSGAFDLKLTQTGVTLYALASGVSGNLTATGAALYTFAAGISGNIILTGQSLFARDGIISGALDTKIVGTGQSLYTIITGMSGQANVNYATLTNLVLTGQQAWGAADSNGRTLSGNLTASGAALGAQIISLSGFTIGASGALQAQIAGANGTQVQVTGSSTLTNANFTGIGSVTVTLSGSRIFVSGAAGGVSQGQLDALSGYSDATFATKSSLDLVSGNLIQTGVQLINRDSAISGGLEVRIVATGNSAVGHANGIGQVISGNLTLSGVALYSMLTGASGLANGASVVLSGALTQTGVQLQSIITNTGLAIGLISGALATQLTNTGAALIARDTTISGGLEVRIALSGQTLYSFITGMSGQDSTDYATKVSLASTGQQAWGAADANGRNVSGNLTTTGVTLGTQIISLSGFTINVSGALQAQIAGANGTQVQVTGSSTLTNANLTGVGTVTLLLSGSRVFVSGAAGLTQAQLDSLSGYSDATYVTKISLDLVSGNVTQTGVQLINRDNAISGGLEARITATGNSAINQANSIGQTLSGNLTQTGLQVGLVSGAIALNLTNTGVALINRDAAISGGLEVRVTASGQSVLAHANSVGQTLSGNLTTTGLAIGLLSGTLDTKIVATGTTVVTHANGIGTIISGNLTQTGVTLIARDLATSGALDARMTTSGIQLQSIDTATGAALYTMITGASGLANSSLITLSGTLTQSGVQLGLKIDSLSGFTIGASGALQALLAGGGSIVRVSGSSNIAIADFTGIGSTVVLYSGGKVFISGLAGGGGGVPSVNSISTAVTIAGTGGFSVFTIGSTVYVSGFSGVTDMQIPFVSGSLIDGDPNFYWDYNSGTLKIGQPQLLYSGNPLSIAGSGNVIQATIRNRSRTNNATADIVLTSDIGSDFSGYVNLGINNSQYNQSTFDMGMSGDGYLIVDGGNIDICTPTPGKTIQFNTAGTRSYNLRAMITDSGIYIPQSGIFQIGSGVTIDNNSLTIGSGDLSFSGLANNPIAMMYASGRGNSIYGAAFHSARIKVTMPLTTTSQNTINDSVATVGTVSTILNEALGEVTLFTAAAGLSAGNSFTIANAFRGTTRGAGNGFFFVSKFLLNTDWGSGKATSSYGAPSGSRIFVGMSDQAVATQTNLNDPIGSYAGLRYLWASGGAVGTGQYMQNWAISSRDGTNAFTGDIGMTFQTGLYRFAMYCPPAPANQIIYYQLDDILRGSGIAGQITTRLPAGATALRGMAAIGFVSGVKSIGTSVIHLETPNSIGIG